MTIFGLTGGIASGKSHVARLLADRGAVVLDADRHAHAVLDEPAVRTALVDRWGDEILAADGSVRRSKIAERVFGLEPTAVVERRFLEGLVHPRVRERLEAELQDVESQGVPAAVLDIPLLLESGWADRCDAVLFVETPDAIRRERAAARGWSAEELARRERAQTPIAEKRSAADFIVPGSDSNAAKLAIDAVWRQGVAASE